MYRLALINELTHTSLPKLLAIRKDANSGSATATSGDKIIINLTDYSVVT